jgi:hypothetical protein
VLSSIIQFVTLVTRWLTISHASSSFSSFLFSSLFTFAILPSNHLLLFDTLWLGQTPHFSLPIAHSQLHLLFLIPKLHTCHNVLPSYPRSGLPGKPCRSSIGSWLRHGVANHRLLLYCIFYANHATSKWSDEHSLRNVDDHATQRRQLQVLSYLQLC